VPTVVIGLDHGKAPLDVLEQVTVGDREISDVLRSLIANENIQEVALVSTCLRTEIYVVADRFHDAVDDATALLAHRAGRDNADVEALESVYFDRGAAIHLFRVAAGLESVVPGETEVLGQIRRSIERAIDDGTAGPQLEGLFRSAIQAGRRVRNETTIARGSASFGQAAVAMAQRHMGNSLEGTKVVVLGAGALGSGVVKALVDSSSVPAPADVVVVNRTLETAQTLVSVVGSVSRAVAFDQLALELRQAQVLISAVEADGIVIGDDFVAGSSLQLIVDLGMPRTVSSSVTQGTISLLDVEDLGREVDVAMQGRRGEIDAAAQIVLEEVTRYLEDQRGRGAAPTIVSLREQFEEIRVAELQRRDIDLASFTPAQREVVDALTRSLLAKLLHGPTMALKDSAGTLRGERLIDAVRSLFEQ
jgi:glutamyl-tRNA reductase